MRIDVTVVRKACRDGACPVSTTVRRETRHATSIEASSIDALFYFATQRTL
jgi:hypothetical protein